MTSGIKVTPLNAAHRRLGAKMVNFAGWDMPLHYGSQIEEHHRVRRDAGMFDVSHMLVVDICGAGVRNFLRTILANDVARLTQRGSALYSCMLNDGGGVIDDLIVYFMEESWFRLVVNAGTAERDVAWIEACRTRDAPQLKLEAPRELAMIAVQGPRAREKAWRARPDIRAACEPLAYFRAIETANMMVSRTGYTGEDGYEIILPAERAAEFWYSLKEQDVAPAGLGARDTLRLEAGMNLYGQDMDENVSPLESGLAWTVALNDQRNFIGKQALLAKSAPRKLIGLILVDKGVMRRHQKVRCANGDGEITSGGFSPTINRSIAFARLPEQAAPGDMVEVKMRDNWVRARVVKPPFVRNGKILIVV